jgi:hypothetical protein
MCEPCAVCVWTGNERNQELWNGDSDSTASAQAVHKASTAQAMNSWVDAMMSMPYDPSDEVVVDMDANREQHTASSLR